MTTRRSTRAAGTGATDVVLGLLLLAAAAFVLVAPLLGVAPSLPGLAGLALISGALGIVGALLGRTSAGFTSEIVAAAMMVAFGLVVVRFPATPVGTLVLLVGALAAATGIVRLASVSEYPQVRGVFLITGAASAALAVAALSGLVPDTLASIALLVGIALVIDGASAVAIGRLGGR